MRNENRINKIYENVPFLPVPFLPRCCCSRWRRHPAPVGAPCGPTRWCWSIPTAPGIWTSSISSSRTWTTLGFPYTVQDIATNAPGPGISNYAVIIIGHSQLDTNHDLPEHRGSGQPFAGGLQRDRAGQFRQRPVLGKRCALPVRAGHFRVQLRVRRRGNQCEPAADRTVVADALHHGAASDQRLGWASAPA